ncbi:MAG TPA: hypothetical protein VJS44_12560 [Pyrinomonadaceae bacterium]|nr:hypothetical protein [Pyrinomonadaceae bacterium]
MGVTVLTIWVTRLYADRFGSDDLSAVLIFRIYSSVLLAVSALGMPIAVQRTTAYLMATPGRAGTSAVVGLAIGLTSIGAACLACTLAAPVIASFLKYPEASSLWKAFMLLTFTQALATMVSLLQIVRGRILESTLVTLASFGVAPVFSLKVWPTASLAFVIIWSAIFAGAAALPSLFSIYRWALLNGIKDMMREARGLLQYGLPRVFASAIEPLLDLTLPWLALMWGAGLVEAGSLAIGLALLRPLNPITGVLNLILIPDSAAKAARSETLSQSSQMRRISEWSLHIGLFATLQLTVWCDVLIVLWLGPSYASAGPVVRLITLSLAPSFIYGAVRGIIDGETAKPINTINLLISLVALLAVSASNLILREGIFVLAFAYLVSRMVLAGLTLRYALRVHALRFMRLHPVSAFVWSALLALVAWAVRALLPPDYAVWALVLLSPVSAIIFVAAMAGYKVEWANTIVSRLRLVS